MSGHERIVTDVNLKTGEVTQRRTVAPGEATIEERFAALEALAGEQLHGPVLERVMWVKCNGCGVVEQVSEPTLPEGWSSTEHGDFCSYACATIAAQVIKESS